MIHVEGIPQGQGALSSSPFRRKDGSLGVNTFSTNKAKLEPWRDKVERTIRTAIKDNDQHFNNDDPLVLFCQFRFQVPKSKVKKKKGYPLDMTMYPDLDHLTRSIGDAWKNGTGVDDSRFSETHCTKSYVLNYEDVGVDITIAQFSQRYEPI